MFNIFLLPTLITLLNIYGCTNFIQETSVTNSIYQDSYKSPFDVRPGYRSNTNFSPKIDDEFIGIRIDAPEVVKFIPDVIIDEFGTFAYIPVSLTYRFALSYEQKFDSITDHMVIVAVDAVSGESFSSTLEVDESVEHVPNDLSNVTEEELSNTFSTGYLTINLADYLDLPQIGSKLHIHVTLEEFQTNTVTVELQEDND